VIEMSVCYSAINLTRALPQTGHYLPGVFPMATAGSDWEETLGITGFLSRVCQYNVLSPRW